MGGSLVIMGSGETAPTMVKPHRAIFDRVGDRPAVMLDTPYGFQENADDISSRAVGYFAASVGRRIEVVSWRTPPAQELARERALASIREAGWVFAGPGSPTYALRQWRDTPVPQLLADTVNDGGVVVFASAAALTLGSHTIPVYEIYKAGIAPSWEYGLDLVRQVTGLPAVVIPHYDNAEGGHHDTRYCYLGERRLSALEGELPPEAFIIGVDEHTGVQLDIVARTVSVFGNGHLTIRQAGRCAVFPTGSVLDFDELTAHIGDPVGIVDASSTVDDLPDEAEPVAAASLGAATEAAGNGFDAALAGRDVDGCVTAILELDRAQLDWAADTLVSDEGDRARSELRRMVVRLGELAQLGARDPAETVRPYVELLLELRQRARAAKDYESSDWIRDRLAEAGVEVRDTTSGMRWQLLAAQS